jgi:hypothetical protein
MKTSYPRRYRACIANKKNLIDTPAASSALDAQFQSVHNAINAKRTDAANKMSAKLDPFNPKMACNCDE